MKALAFEMHVDWFDKWDVPKELASALIGLGFVTDVVCGGPFAPLMAWSFRCPEPEHEKFDEVVSQAKVLLSRYQGLPWYAETEVVLRDVSFGPIGTWDPHEPHLPLPFVARLTPQLATAVRQPSELHLTFGGGDVREWLIGTIVRDLDAYPARFKRSTGENLVFTVQGTKDEIRQIVPLLEGYLRGLTAFEKASLKVENLIWFEKGSPQVQVPPRIRTLVFFDQVCL